MRLRIGTRKCTNPMIEEAALLAGCKQAPQSKQSGQGVGLIAIIHIHAEEYHLEPGAAQNVCDLADAFDCMTLRCVGDKGKNGAEIFLTRFACEDVLAAHD